MTSEDDYTVEIRKLEIRKHEDAIRAMLPGKHGNELTEVLLRANSIRKLMVDWRGDFDLAEEWWEQLHAFESEREAAKSEAIRDAKRPPGERVLDRKNEMSVFLSKLGPFKWSLHNLVAHPLSEFMYLIGLEQASNWIHDATIPEHEPGQGRG